MAKGHTFQAPTGTRDFYPADMLRRRYIEKMWRDTSIRHGFEEIDGPTFEHLDLYTVKSGEAIVNELFSFKRAGGEKDYALRPEFTPTLARMYAAKAGGLPKPTKWFWQQSCFRAERPQRGRLREFLQWNVDFIGDASPAADAETIACCVRSLTALGLTHEQVRVRYNHRAVLATLLSSLGVSEEHTASAFILLDRRDRLTDEELEAMAFEFGLTGGDFIAFLKRPRGAGSVEEVIDELPDSALPAGPALVGRLRELHAELENAGVAEWCDFDLNIARGLAYYTGMVFEVHEAGGKERAIAGGGRYDNLVELFGGPPTPAVGFGMGDVVLSLVLQDKGLLPEGAVLMDKLSELPASPRPDVFVISNDKPESIAAVRPLVARLRRGWHCSPSSVGSDTARESGATSDTARESGATRPLHARHSYKATKNIGKLLQEASACHARFAAILESGTEATLKDLGTGGQAQNVPLNEIAGRVSAPC